MNRVKLSRYLVSRYLNNIQMSGRSFSTTSHVIRKRPEETSPSVKNPLFTQEAAGINQQEMSVLLDYIKHDQKEIEENNLIRPSLISSSDLDQTDALQKNYIPVRIRHKQMFDSVKDLLLMSRDDPNFPELLLKTNQELPPSFDPRIVSKDELKKRIDAVHAWIDLGFDPSNFFNSTRVNLRQKTIRTRVNMLMDAGFRPEDIYSIIGKNFKTIMYFSSADLRINQKKKKHFTKIRTHTTTLDDMMETVKDHLSQKYMAELKDQLKQESYQSIYYLSYRLVMWYLHRKIPDKERLREFTVSDLLSETLDIRSAFQIIDVISLDEDCLRNLEYIEWDAMFDRMKVDRLKEFLVRLPFLNSTHISRYFKRDMMYTFFYGVDHLLEKINLLKSWGFDDSCLDTCDNRVLCYKIETLQKRFNYWTAIIPKETIVNHRNGLGLFICHETAKFRYDNNLYQKATSDLITELIKSIGYPRSHGKKQTLNGYQVRRLRQLCLKHKWDNDEIQRLLSLHNNCSHFGRYLSDLIIEYLVNVQKIKMSCIENSPYILLYPLPDIKKIFETHDNEFVSEWGLSHPRLLDYVVYLLHNADPYAHVNNTDNYPFRVRSSPSDSKKSEPEESV